jgi:hypothetical protein
MNSKLISKYPMTWSRADRVILSFFRTETGNLGLDPRAFALAMNVIKYCEISGILYDNVMICSTHCLFMTFEAPFMMYFYNI